MANNVLPARLGEFVRAYILAQREGLQTPAVFASLVIDRLFDGFTVMLILLFTLFTLRLPQGLSEAETVLKTGGVVTFVLYAGVVAFLILLKRQTMRTLAWTALLLKPFPQRLTPASPPSPPAPRCVRSRSVRTSASATGPREFRLAARGRVHPSGGPASARLGRRRDDVGRPRSTRRRRRA